MIRYITKQELLDLKKEIEEIKVKIKLYESHEYAMICSLRKDIADLRDLKKCILTLNNRILIISEKILESYKIKP